MGMHSVDESLVYCSRNVKFSKREDFIL